MAAKPRTRHGLHALKVAVKTRDVAALDRRCAGAKALLQWRLELLTALGGEENVTPQKRVLVDAIVRSKLYLDHVDSFLMTQPSLVNKKRRAVLPILLQREQLVASLSRLLSQIGLERQEGRIKTLAEYIREHDAKQIDGEAEPEADPEPGQPEFPGPT